MHTKCFFCLSTIITSPAAETFHTRLIYSQQRRHNSLFHVSAVCARLHSKFSFHFVGIYFSSLFPSFVFSFLLLQYSLYFAFPETSTVFSPPSSIYAPKLQGKIFFPSNCLEYKSFGSHFFHNNVSFTSTLYCIIRFLHPSKNNTMSSSSYDRKRMRHTFSFFPQFLLFFFSILSDDTLDQLR